MSHSKASVLVLLAIAACVTEARPPALAAEVQAGPGGDTRPNRVLVLPARCGSVERRCPPEYSRTVDEIVRGGLEFAGYTLVESEGLLNKPRQRYEEHTTETKTSESRSTTDTERPLGLDTKETSAGQSTSSTETTRIILDGSTFEDLSVTERHEVLTKAGADAVLTVRIVVGGQTGVWLQDQNVEVMVKLGVNNGDAMAWASRCSASSVDFATVTAALENAARCAVHGATAR